MTIEINNLPLTLPTVVGDALALSGVAMTALGAGYETINPGAAGYNLVTVHPDRVAITKGRVGYPITVTKTTAQTDLDAIATGTVPPSLLSDAVHYNANCKTVIGNMLYARMRDLNII